MMLSKLFRSLTMAMGAAVVFPVLAKADELADAVAANKVNLDTLCRCGLRIEL